MKTLKQMCSHLSSLTISLGAVKVGAVSFPAGRVVCKGWTRSLESSLEIPAFKKNQTQTYEVIDHKFPIQI